MSEGLPGATVTDQEPVEPEPGFAFADLPFRFHQFENPVHAPYFDKEDCRWASTVGHFFRKIVQDPAVKGFVFLNHGDTNVELQFASADYQRVENEMVVLSNALGIKRKTRPTDGQTLGKNAFRGSRWIADGRDDASRDAAIRITV